MHTTISLEDEVHQLKTKLHEQEVCLEKHIDEINSLTARLAETKKENAELFDFSSSNYFTIDKNHIIQSVNFKAALLFGLDRKLLINQTLVNFMTYKSKNTFRYNIQKVLRTKLKQIFEIEILPKGGGIKYVIMECTIYKNQTIRLCLNDIANTRNLEMQAFELKKSFYLLNTLFHNASIAVATLDSELNIKIINTLFTEWFSKIFWIPLKNDMNFSKALSKFPELKNKIINASHEALLGKKITVLFESNNTDQNYYCYKINIISFFNEYPQKMELVFSIRDITLAKIEEKRQHKLYSEIALATRASSMGEITSALAHEINQPLTAIVAYTRGCLFTLKQNEEHKAIFNKLISPLEHIATQAVLAGQIIHNMKNFMKNGLLFVEETDINMLIKESLTMLGYELLDFKLNIILDFVEYLPKIMTNKIHIIQIILNLARNSIEALQSIGSDNPALTIRTRKSDQYIVIHIIDNGPGIPVEFQDKILKTYFTTKHKGSGIGLGICRSLTEAHGGELTINNDHKNGAWFTFTLPTNLTNDDANAKK